MTPHTQSQSESCDCGLFFLDTAGKFTRETLLCHFVPTPRQSNETVEALIEQTWQERLKQQSGGVLFDGLLARLISYAPNRGQLDLTLGSVSYKEFFATNILNPTIRYTHGPEVLGDALGVSAAVISADGYILLGKRSMSVSFHAGRIHPLGGMVEMETPQKPANPFDSISAELCQELGIGRSAIVSSVCVGLVRDKRIVQPELIFDISVDLPVASICPLANEARDSHEHTEIVTVRNEQTAVVTFIGQNSAELTPVGIATLLLHGLNVWGSGWFTAARGYLRKVV